MIKLIKKIYNNIINNDNFNEALKFHYEYNYPFDNYPFDNYPFEQSLIYYKLYKESDEE